MYDTEKRIELVKKRMHEYHRRQERRTVCRLSALKGRQVTEVIWVESTVTSTLTAWLPSVRVELYIPGR